MSLIQNRFEGVLGIAREPIPYQTIQRQTSQFWLPNDFSIVPETAVGTQVPKFVPSNNLRDDIVDEAILGEQSWLKKAQTLLEKNIDNIKQSDRIVWSTHHAFFQPVSVNLPVDVP
eukprot:Pompholyxophrys_punicea_v1_NODE_121_length_3355_cov_8.294759.p3 type:complete len:116 gc:universal NODE_121_length_3355_cov_8.294759:1161-1508(+)